MKLREAKAYRRRIESVAAEQDDEKALDNVDLFPRWAAGIDVEACKRMQHDGVLYKCIQPHRTQADWTPNVTPALWRKVGEVEDVVDNDYPEYVPPTGAHDAYNKGDKMTFEGQRYESLINGNIWSPTEYPVGWKLIS